MNLVNGPYQHGVGLKNGGWGEWQFIEVPHACRNNLAKPRPSSQRGEGGNEGRGKPLPRGRQGQTIKQPSNSYAANGTPCPPGFGCLVPCSLCSLSGNRCLPYVLRTEVLFYSVSHTHIQVLLITLRGFTWTVLGPNTCKMCEVLRATKV